jgi:hydrogenase expression/formation protein HypD
MKYIDEFRDGDVARKIAERLRAEAAGAPASTASWSSAAATRTPFRATACTELLPPQVRMIHGPGCPVCVLPIGRVDMAIQLALEHGAIVCTYGDTMRVPASDGLSLTEGQGARRRHPHGLFAADALTMARDNPDREVVFFAIGFETTTPPTALAILRSAARGPGQLQRAVLPRADAVGHHAHPGVARGAPATARCRSTASSARRT